jgi:hypothetical protein
MRNLPLRDIYASAAGQALQFAISCVGRILPALFSQIPGKGIFFFHLLLLPLLLRT